MESLPGRGGRNPPPPGEIGLSFLLEINNITIIGIQDKNMKNSIKSKNCPKSKTLREIETLDWYIVIKPSVSCSGRKASSEKMSVDSIQHQLPWPTCSYT